MATNAPSPTPSSSSGRSQTFAAVTSASRPRAEQSLGPSFSLQSPSHLILGMKLCWDFASNGTCKYGALSCKPQISADSRPPGDSHPFHRASLRRSLHACPWPPRAPGARPRASGALADCQNHSRDRRKKKNMCYFWNSGMA